MNDTPVVVARIGRPHGVRGELTVVPTPHDRALFQIGAVMTTDDGRTVEVVSVSPFRDRGLIVGFSGVITRDEAETLRGHDLTVPPSARRQLDDDEFWPEDLIGLVARGPDGTVLGTVSRIEFGVGQDRIAVALPTGGDVLVPFVSEIVSDPENGSIVITDPGGLFPN